MRVAASFGAGMGRMREVCGAVSGMFLVAGMETGATHFAALQKEDAAFHKTASIFSASLFARSINVLSTRTTGEASDC